MKALENLTRKQKILGFVVLVLLLIVALVYNSDFLRPKDRSADADKVVELQQKENEDLNKVTGKEEGQVTGLTIADSPDLVNPGGQVQFAAIVQGEGDYDQKVAWTITSPHNEKTNINESGLLTVDLEEKTPDLIIEASAGDGNYKAERTIKVQVKAPEAKPVEKPKNKQELKAKAQSEQAKLTEAEKAKRDQNDQKIKQEAIAKTSGGKKDKYLTDPTPAGRPKPVEPGTVVKEDKVETCTLSINCATILNNMDRFNMDKIDVLPVDGVILPATSVEFHPGESVYDVLNREVRERKIHMESNFTPAYNSAYVMGINNLYEFDCGELSGWMYKVNGWFPNYGCSRYEVKAGDTIDWVYTCDLGRDVGDNSMTK